MTLSEKLVDLRIATRGATMCETACGKNKNTLSLKTKILFLLRNKSLQPIDLLTSLKLAKANLALLTTEMAKEGLIQKDKQNYDKRVVAFSITDKGREYLETRLSVIENSLKKPFLPPKNITRLQRRSTPPPTFYRFYKEPTMLKVYNTLTRRKEEFVPLNDKVVTMYSCGPTVYSYAHIGNMRAYLFMDSVRRTLKYNGYKLKGVMNITDVGHLLSDGDDGEDKMEKASREQQNLSMR